MGERRVARGIVSLLLLGAFGASVGTAPPASAAPTTPAQDPFYRYTGAKPLASIPPGTVLKHRQITIALGTQPTPVPATQLLYRTRGELGEPTVTVTTVLVPPNGPTLRPIIGYLSFYDALGAQCDPSYTLRGGDPGQANREQTEVEEALIAAYYATDAIVTIPDFEGENLEWTAGHEAGYDSLDAVRATEAYSGLPASTKVGLTGYSGGSIAAEWAAELAPAYAPKLNIVGVAAGGIPVDFAHNLRYINGTPDWSGVIPAALVALARAYRIDLPPYLSPYGAKLTAQVQTACIGSFQGAYPGLKIQQLLKPQYQDIYHDVEFVRVMNALLMGSVPGHPKGPLFLGVGDMDGTGDGVMVAADVEGLAHEYCQQGVPLQLHIYNGDSHTQAALKFEPQAIAFLTQQFAGAPFQSNCSSVGVGNSLAPLPLPASSGATAAANSVRAQSGRDGLAATGMGAGLATAAGILLGLGLLATRRRFWQG